MSEERLAVEIRDAFDTDHEPNRGLEDRVLAAIPWEAPKRRWTLSWPRLAGSLAAVVAVIAIGVLVAPSVLTRMNITHPGTGPVAIPPAYSLASVAGNSVFVVQRGGPLENALLQSVDGGRTWIDRLHFKGIYDGMQMYGQDGFIWAIDMGMANCNGTGGACQPPSQHVALYYTWDGGASWTLRPDPGIAVNGIFFLGGQRGWIDSGSPASAPGGDTLYATTDGGFSWKLVGPLPQSAPMAWVYGVGDYHVTFSDPLRGWYLGNGSLFTTVDGGKSWQPLALHFRPVTSYMQPIFSGRDGILPVAYRNPNGPDNATPNQLSFLRTSDGGATWNIGGAAPNGFTPVGDIVSIAALVPHDIWLTSQSLTGGDNVQVGPAVARTTDGGLSWTVTHQTWRILQMAFKDATHGFALDVTGTYNVNGILSTTDGGATWKRVNVPLFG
ncbi:MAG TPA: hypothetical protein VGV88_08575 [Candidatus Dormibacteraeota bacterium]|nr:hypothetical protein [Candidatus Dormibacteraeota bacterium]